MFALLFAEHADLWTVQSPSGVGLLIACLLVGVALVGAVLCLRQSSHPVEKAPQSSDEVALELERIERGREELLQELAQAPAGLRSALEPLLAAPLGDFAERVRALVATASRASATRVAAHEHLQAEIERLEAERRQEEDPRAQALLEASLTDLRATRVSSEELARNARLARLELSRMRTLVSTLPAKVRELASRHGLGEGEILDVEGIARQLELAVRSTGEVLG